MILVDLIQIQNILHKSESESYINSRSNCLFSRKRGKIFLIRKEKEFWQFFQNSNQKIVQRNPQKRTKHNLSKRNRFSNFFLKKTHISQYFSSNIHPHSHHQKIQAKYSQSTKKCLHFPPSKWRNIEDYKRYERKKNTNTHKRQKQHRNFFKCQPRSCRKYIERTPIEKRNNFLQIQNRKYR